MILIADCGSTKIDWCVLDNDKLTKQVFTCGMNAVMLTEEEMRKRIGDELVPELGDLCKAVKAVYFYGAGCISAEVCGNVARAIKANLQNAETVEVYSDLLAAARALCGHNPGIACIMGTGSNSCFYDGKGIAANVSPLGFILGDEGSGAYMGKRMIADMLKGLAPKELTEAFFEKNNVTPNMLLDEVYTNKLPSKRLSQYSAFLRENLENSYCYRLVYNAFMDFFTRNIISYDYAEMPLSFVGSVCVMYQPILIKAASDFGVGVKKIIPNSMPGLVAYHCEE